MVRRKKDCGEGHPPRRAPAFLRAIWKVSFMVARMQERHMPFTRRLRPVQVVETLSQTTRIEMDLRLEAAALSEIAENIKEMRGSGFPRWTGSARAAMC